MENVSEEYIEGLKARIEKLEALNRTYREALEKIKRLTANDREGIELWNLITEVLNHK